MEPARIASFSSLPPRRFPFWVFNPKNSASIHYRSAALAQYYLSKKIFRLEKKSQNHQFIYSSLLSKEDCLLSKVSLWSLLRKASCHPRITLGLDSNLSRVEAEKYFADWAVKPEFYTTQEVADWHINQGNESIAWFCLEHVFGFKLALNLMLAHENNVFYADSDVLWFGDFSSALDFHNKSSSIQPSIDSGQRPFDVTFMEQMGESMGFEPYARPHGCAGVCFFQHGVKATEEVKSWVDWLRSNHVVNRLSEQTIISAIGKCNNSFLSTRIMAMDTSTTKFSLSQTRNNSLGRHYPANMRTQFWIDAANLCGVL
jgi:hypothetical protein